MIRFIDLTNQIFEDTFCFAWYDTVVDKFINVGDCFIWLTWGEFWRDYKSDRSYSKPTLERFAKLFPKGGSPKHIEAATAAAGGSEIEQGSSDGRRSGKYKTYSYCAI